MQHKFEKDQYLQHHYHDYFQAIQKQIETHRLHSDVDRRRESQIAVGDSMNSIESLNELHNDINADSQELSSEQGPLELNSIPLKEAKPTIIDINHPNDGAMSYRRSENDMKSAFQYPMLPSYTNLQEREIANEKFIQDHRNYLKNKAIEETAINFEEKHRERKLHKLHESIYHMKNSNLNQYRENLNSEAKVPPIHSPQNKFLDKVKSQARLKSPRTLRSTKDNCSSRNGPPSSYIDRKSSRNKPSMFKTYTLIENGQAVIHPPQSKHTMKSTTRQSNVRSNKDAQILKDTHSMTSRDRPLTKQLNLASKIVEFSKEGALKRPSSTSRNHVGSIHQYYSKPCINEKSPSSVHPNVLIEEDVEIPKMSQKQAVSYHRMLKALGGKRSMFKRHPKPKIWDPPLITSLSQERLQVQDQKFYKRNVIASRVRNFDIIKGDKAIVDKLIKEGQGALTKEQLQYLQLIPLTPTKSET